MKTYRSPRKIKLDGMEYDIRAILIKPKLKKTIYSWCKKFSNEFLDKFYL